MYRKLILVVLVFLFASESSSQIGFTMLTVSASGVLYTFFRPIKETFEDRLQTFVLFIPGLELAYDTSLLSPRTKIPSYSFQRKLSSQTKFLPLPVNRGICT